MKRITQVNGKIEDVVNNVVESLKDLDENVFAKSKNDVGRISIDKHHIRIKDDVAPISLRPYRQSPALAETIRENVIEMM